MAQLGKYMGRMTTLQGGVNLYGAGERIAEYYARKLYNMDSRKPGEVVKRKEPTKVCDAVVGMSNCNGVNGFVDGSGNRWLVFAAGGKLWKWNPNLNSNTPQDYTPINPGGSGNYNLSTINRVRADQCNNVLYVVDGANYLTRFDGATAQGITPGSQVTSLPIIAGTLVFTWTGHTVTDDGNQNLLLDGTGSPIGSIVYATGAYTFSGGTPPWSSSDTVTAAWTQARQSSQQTLVRAASDGTLQYPALANGAVLNSSLTLTDGANYVDSNYTVAGGSFPSGWCELIDRATPPNVVGAYDIATGKFMVTTGVFTPGAAITASYNYGTTMVAPFALSSVSVANGGTGYVTSAGDSGLYVVAGTPTDAGVLGVSTAGDPGPATDVFIMNDAGSWPYNPGSGVYSTVNYPGAGQTGSGLTVNCVWTGTPSSIPVTNEPVGTADSAGMLKQFVVGTPSLSPLVLTLSDGTNLVQDYVGSGNLKNSVGTTVGTIDYTTGIPAVTTGSFTAGADVVATLLTPTSVTSMPVSSTLGADTLGAQGVAYAATDVLWQDQRLCVAVGPNFWFSDALTPEAFNSLPKGVGIQIKRIRPYSFQQVLLFCGPSAKNDSIYMVDMTMASSTSTPANWPTQLIFDGLTFTSPNSILRASTNSLTSDIFFRTAEGLRSLKLTQQDDLSGPTLPLDIHIQPIVDEILPQGSTDPYFAEVFKEELLQFVSLPGDTGVRSVLCYNMQVAYLQQGQSTYLPTDGWATISLPFAVREAITWDFNDGNGKQLFVIDAAGNIYTMFTATTTAQTGTIEGKAHCELNQQGEPTLRDIIPQWLTVWCDPSSAGTFSVALVDDQDRQYNLGSHTIGGSAPTLNLHSFECRDNSGALPSSKSWSVLLTTSDYVVFTEWELECMTENRRHTEMDDDESGGTNAPGITLPAAITPGAF